MSKPWRRYSTGHFFDELMTEQGSPRVAARRAVNFFRGLSIDELQARRQAAALAIKEMGISFTVYTEGGNIDRAWPFDMIPRVISAREWSRVSQGYDLFCVRHGSNAPRVAFGRTSSSNPQLALSQIRKTWRKAGSVVFGRTSQIRTADLYHVKADWPHQDTRRRHKTLTRGSFEINGLNVVVRRYGQRWCRRD